MSLAFDVDRPVPIRQGVELGIGFLHRSLQQLFRERWKPQMVCFTHAAPTRKDAHRKFFGTDILFNEDFNGIVCRSGDLDAAVPAADAKMARYVQQYLDTRRKITMTANVRECIYTMLPTDGKDESRPETIEVNSTRANGLNVAPILKCKLISRIRSYFAEPPVPFRSALTDCSPVEIFWSSNQKCSSLSGILARPPSGPSSGRGHF